MNHFDPTFLARSKAAFLSKDQITLADVKRLAEADSSLMGTQRRDLASALNRIEQLFQTPLMRLEAVPRRVREVFASKSPAQLDLSEKTFANIRSLVAKAVQRYGQPVSPLTKRIPVSPSWQDLLDRIAIAYQRQALYRLATYCSVMGIAPEEVTTETLLGLFEGEPAHERGERPSGGSGGEARGRSTQDRRHHAGDRGRAYQSSMKARLAELEAEKAAFISSRDASPTVPNVSVHPNLAAVYRKKVEELESLLEDAEHRDEAMVLIRSLIDKIDLSPREGGGVEAILHGDLARILALCSTGAQDAKPRRVASAACSKRNEALEVGVPQGLRLSVVAGTGFEPVTFRL